MIQNKKKKLKCDDKIVYLVLRVQKIWYKPDYYHKLDVRAIASKIIRSWCLQYFLPAEAQDE